MDEMTESTEYLLEKFRTGVEILAASPGPIKERLEDAYSSQITRGENPSSDVPEDLRDRINAFHDRMRQVKDDTGTIGHVRATVAAMTEQEAIDLAQEVLAIEQELRGLSGYEGL